MNNQNINLNRQSIYAYKKPKNRWLKISIITVVVLIIGFVVWMGSSALSAMRKITSEGNENGSLFAFLGDFAKNNLDGQNDGRTNILMLGMGGKNHPGGLLSDTIIIASYDWQNKKMAMISVPRDLWVSIPNYGYAKINEAYAYGEKNPKIAGSGSKAAADTVSKIFDIPIHYTLSIDFAGFEKLIDEIGGVDILVEKDLIDYSYPADNMVDYAPLKIKSGLQHMNGDLALKYARSRKSTSDFDRSKRQEQVLFAIKEKTFTLNTLGNPKKVADLLNILGDHFRTSLSVGEIKVLWDSLQELEQNNVVNVVLDTAANGPLTALQDERGYIIIPKKGIGKYDDLQKLAKNIFNSPVSQESKTSQDLSEYKIEVLNGSGKTGQATEAAEKLETAGYKVEKIGNATSKMSETTVYNCSGVMAQNAADAIAEMFSGVVKTKTSCVNIDIQVIIGQDSL
jgi:LCP family protein required for cell wall assembly